MKRINKLKALMGIIICFSLFSVSLLGCSGVSETGNSNIDDNEKEVNRAMELSDEDLPIATINIKGYGSIKAELYPNIAENTVRNFISLANSGFYDGLTFHRIIDNFMIQGGDPNGDGTGGTDYCIKGEFKANGIENTLKHEDGVLSMARSNSYNSAGSQFFIMNSTATYLDGNYAAFGKVIEGMDIVYKISKVSTDANDKPLEDVIIESITIDTKGIEYDEPIKIN